MTTTAKKTKRVNYGIDAPRIVITLFIIGMVLLTLVYFFPGMNPFILNTLVWCGAVTLLESVLMFLYAKFGKFRQRDRILALHKWTGNEKVLDIGTGLGLLMNGTAKKLTTGRAIGIDIWNKADLSSNNRDNALQNAIIEGVENKIEIQNQNIIQTSFADKEFDVIVSNLCLHNIYKEELRKNACKEIYRILKDDGVAIISDFKHTGKYADNFRSLGMKVERFGPYLLDTFPPLTIIKASKLPG